MRYIFMMMILATMLFSQQQRQIILGSFSIESNALFYSLDAQKHVAQDAKLKKLIDKYSLEVEYNKVGDYNVVTIYPFDDYPSLFATIAVVKKYYPSAYAIKYPALATLFKARSFEEEEEKESIFDKEESQTQDIKYEPKLFQAEPLEVDTSSQSFSMDELLLLIALLLVLIVFILYKIKVKKNKENKENEEE